MIYLSRHRLLFLKPKKTAGTSIELALSCNADDDADIITPIAPKGLQDEVKRFEIGGRMPQNWARFPISEALFLKRFHKFRSLGELPKGLLRQKPKYLYQRFEAKYFNHITPDQVRNAGGQEILQNSYFVTVARHPFETVVSSAWHLNSKSGNSFEEDLERAISLKPLNNSFLFADRRPDFVLRFENLKADLALLESRFSMSLVEKLPMTKTGFRKDRQPAINILDNKQKESIVKKYGPYFSELGYQN